MKPGATLIALLAPALKPDIVEVLARRPITAMSMDAVPRISRAQSLDVLSSMAQHRRLPGRDRGRARVRPVLHRAGDRGREGAAGEGAGGRGRGGRAVGDRRGGGAGRDRAGHRPAAGGRRPGRTRWAGSTCRSPRRRSRSAPPATPRRWARTTRRARRSSTPSSARDVDIIITTALIPGRPAPRIITAEMVASMKPGSVIVDMAAANGGNVEGTVAGQKIVTSNGVTIIGYTDLAGRLAAQASQLYGTNLVNLMKLLTPGKDGQLVLDFDDVVQRSMTVVRDGEKTWPPPPVSVSAAPAAAPASPAGRRGRGARQGRQAAHVRAPPVRHRRDGRGRAVRGHRAVAARADRAPGRVRAGHRDRLLRDRARAPCAAHPADVGDERDLRHHRRRRAAAGRARTISAITIVAALAILLATINVFGGFAVTRRMLAMFRRS